MNRRSWILSAVSAGIMILPPLLFTVTAADPCGFGTFLLLFYFLDPIWSCVLGALSQRYFLLPLINAVLFVVGAWCFFDFGEADFLLFAAVYLALGYVTQLISLLIRRLIKKKKNN